jgi:isopentenyldiphosphate isomerase
MDELVDVLDVNGVPTGKTVLKSVAHREGILHPVAHVWIYTGAGMVLLQKRSFSKEVYPGLWDVSMGGHISAGEDIIQGALREIKEELGKQFSAGNLRPAFIHSTDEDLGTLKVREVIHVFLCRCDDPISSYAAQESEVDDIKFFSFDSPPSNIVPRPEYHRKVRAALKNQLHQ